MKFSFTGIRRRTDFSPNHIENDLFILRKTAEEIERRGYTVRLIEESQLGQTSLESSVIFNMCQGKAAVDHLRKIEAEGKLIINNPQSVLNCYRYNMTSLLPSKGISFPKTFLVETSNPNNIPEEVKTFKGIWIKRGDVHAVVREDVIFVPSAEKIPSILESYRRRNIEKAILQEHLEGNVVKFYAVQKNEFFEWYYSDKKHRKQLFEERELYRLAELSAETLGLDVYGGDAVVAENGALAIIDINDWPSYAPFRERASKHIAEAIIEKARIHGKLID